jgi:hypothetical protein
MQKIANKIKIIYKKITTNMRSVLTGKKKSDEK